MEFPGLAAEPEWKQYLRLGEQLLNLPDMAAQCRLIEQSLTNLLGCQAVVWLAQPIFPLPGQTQTLLLPHPDASALVTEAFTRRQPLFRAPQKPITPSKSSRNLRWSAFPLMARDMLLGIIEASRPTGPAFRPEEIAFLEGLSAHVALSIEINRQAALKNWRYEQLSLVRSVSAQIANVLDLDELCSRVVHLIQETFDFYHVSLFSVDDPSGSLRFRACAGRQGSDHTTAMPNLHIQQGLVNQVAVHGIERIAHDVKADPLYTADDTLPNTQSEAALPIKLENRILGVLDVKSDRLNGFHEVDILVLHALADNIARAIESARLYTDLKRRAEQISGVFEITHTLTSLLDLDSLLDAAVQAIHKHFGFSFVHLFAVHSGRRKIFYLAGSGTRSEAMRNLEITYELDDPTGLIPWVARNNRTRLANDISSDPIYRPSELPPDDTRSELTIPLTFGGDVLGILDIQSDRVNAFDEDVLPILESLAASLAIAYHNARIYKAEQWRRQVGDSFRDVASLLSSNVALEKLLETILNELERNLPCESAAIWLSDDSEDAESALYLAAVHGVGAEQVTRALQESPQAHQFMHMALTSDQATIRLPDHPSGPLGLALNYPPDYSSIAAPLRIGSQPIGVLTLAHHTAGRYGSEAFSMTTTFASYAAVAIQVARLYAQAQEQAWVSTILLQVAEASQSVNSVDELLSTMVRLSRLLVGIKKSAVFLYDNDRQSFELRAWYGMENLPADLIFPPGRAPALDQLRAIRETTFVTDPAAELDLPAAEVPSDTGTIVLLPLLSRDELLGVFLVAHQSSNHPGAMQTFDQQTLSIYQGIAHQTAVALENLILLEARQEEAYVTAVLLQVAQAVVSQNDLVDILDTIVHLTPILVGIDACIIYLWDSSVQAFRTVQAFTGSLQTEMMILEHQFSPGDFNLLDNILRDDSAYFATLPQGDFNPAEWNTLECIPIEELEKHTLPAGTHWVLGFPLSVKGELVGAMLTQERTTLSASQQRRLEIMNGIAQQVALAIQNDRLRQEAIVQERINREVQLARQIQQTFLPSRLPNRKSWEMAARWQPAREVGGDFYDIFSLTKERLGIAIADVSDKGMPAALYMTVGRTLIRAYANNAKNASTLLQRINTPLVTDTPNSMFITAVYAILWPETGHLLYANAGHNRPYILRPNRMEIEILPKGGMAMGVLESIRLEDSLHILEPGDCFLLYTDGVTESFSPSGEPFGENRLQNILRLNIHKSVNELLDILEASLIAFREGAPPTDDVTMVAIRHLPPAQSEIRPAQSD